MSDLRVAYVSSYAYAAGPANDVRSQGVVAALRSLGCAVDLMEQPGAMTDGWEMVATSGPWGRAARLLGMASAVPRWLGALPDRPDVVWLYGLDLRFSARVLRWARRHRVPVVCEVVDWYEPADIAGAGPRFVLRLTNAIAMPWARCRAAGFVVASQGLADYFASPATTARVPAVIPDIEPGSGGVTRVPGGSRTVGYVGSPGRRDGSTLTNLRRVALEWDGPPLEIHVAGPMTAEWPTAPGVVVHQHGRIARDQAVALVAACDAIVLQRPEGRRFARAGFPSKVAESMVLGTAPLTNATSDLALHLTDGADSIILRDDSADALHEGLHRLVDTHLDREVVETTGQESFSVQHAARRFGNLLTQMGLR